MRSEVLPGNAHLPHLGVESPTQKALPRRSAVRTADNAFGLSQRLQNVFALGLLERKGWAKVRCSGGLQFRQGNLQRGPPSEDHRAFQEVFELPNVAGPGILLERLERGRR